MDTKEKRINFWNNKKQVKGKALAAWVIAMIIIFMLFTFGIGIFLGKAVFVKNEEKASEETNTTNNEIQTKEDIINNETRVGKYILYMGKANNGSEYSLTLFSPTDNNDGFFTLVEATSLSYNQVASGYYKINGSDIEFYQNMENDSDKNGFVNAFNMTIEDLYQDATALSEGYNSQFRLKLQYEQNKITNSNLILEKIN